MFAGEKSEARLIASMICSGNDVVGRDENRTMTPINCEDTSLDENFIYAAIVMVCILHIRLKDRNLWKMSKVDGINYFDFILNINNHTTLKRLKDTPDTQDEDDEEPICLKKYEGDVMKDVVRKKKKTTTNNGSERVWKILEESTVELKPRKPFACLGERGLQYEETRYDYGLIDGRRPFTCRPNSDIYHTRMDSFYNKMNKDNDEWWNKRSYDRRIDYYERSKMYHDDGEYERRRRNFRLSDDDSYHDRFDFYYDKRDKDYYDCYPDHPRYYTPHRDRYDRYDRYARDDRDRYDRDDRDRYDRDDRDRYARDDRDRYDRDDCKERYENVKRLSDRYDRKRSTKQGGSPNSKKSRSSSRDGSSDEWTEVKRKPERRRAREDTPEPPVRKRWADLSESPKSRWGISFSEL